MALFPTTRWTLVLQAKTDGADRRHALDELLRLYWRPLYVLARKNGHAHEAAADAVQGFVEHLLAQSFAERLDPERGKMRSFLRASFANFLSHQRERAQAQKRGGGARVVSFDSDEGDALLRTLPQSSEEAFDREWRHLLFERAFERLRKEFQDDSRRSSFGAITEFFLAEGETPSYQYLAQTHGLSVPQLKSALHRSRLRLKELVEMEIADTVAEREHAAMEAKVLFAELGG